MSTETFADIVCSGRFGQEVEIRAEASSCTNRASHLPAVIRLTDNGWLELTAEAKPDAELFGQSLQVGVPDDIHKVTVEVGRLGSAGSEARWIAQLDPRKVRTLRGIRVSAGTYRVIVSAAHYQSSRRIILLPAPKEAVDAVGVDLIPLRIIRGRVRELKTFRPVSDVVVRTADNDRARTDKTGSFSLEISKGWPNSLAVEARGYVPGVVPVERSDQRSFVVPDVMLAHGGVLSLDIIHSSDVTVELAAKSDRDNLLPKVSKTLGRDQTHIDFGPLAAGTYRLHAFGREPFEQFSTAIEVYENVPSYRTLLLQPIPLHISVLEGEDPAPNAVIEADHSAGWRATLRVSPSGRADTTIWQPGRVDAIARLAADGSPFMTSTVLEGDLIEWKILIPHRRLTITVVDAESDLGIADAFVMINQNADGQHLVRSARSDNDGRTILGGLSEGPLKLSFTAKGYFPDEMLTEVTSQENDRTIRQKLRKASGVRLQILDSVGAPAESYVFGPTLAAPFATDADGFCTLPVIAGQTSRVFVVPYNGSLAVVDARASENDIAVPINVPRGDVRLVLHVVTDTGSAVGSIRFRMRYNGIEIPPNVIGGLERQQRHWIQTDASGTVVFNSMPVGLYEFWPMVGEATRSEGTRKFDSAAPISIAAQPGVNSAEITLRMSSIDSKH